MQVIMDTACSAACQLFFAKSDLLIIFAPLQIAGCSSARLEYLSGGQGAPGSNPGIPTKHESPSASWRMAFCFYDVTNKLAFEEHRKNKKTCHQPKD